jgi:hypothetical protein
LRDPYGARAQRNLRDADQSLGATPDIEAAYQRRWERDIRAAGLGEEDFAAALARAAAIAAGRPYRRSPLG